MFRRERYGANAYKHCRVISPGYAGEDDSREIGLPEDRCSIVEEIAANREVVAAGWTNCPELTRVENGDFAHLGSTEATSGCGDWSTLMNDQSRETTSVLPG